MMVWVQVWCEVDLGLETETNRNDQQWYDEHFRLNYFIVSTKSLCAAKVVPEANREWR